jgi:tetratricopeptide (TPR) repeat protein
MLFDLQGKRRRLVQATYLTLAVLMGGGLVLFGIGGDVTGGLLSEGGIFSSDGGSSEVEKAQDERLREAEAELRSNPQNTEALSSVVQIHFNKATGERDEATGAYNARGRSELFAAADAWQRYLATNPDPPSGDVAELMTDIYALTGQYKKARQSAKVAAEQNPSVDAFLALAQYATYAKNKRAARRAGDKAIELAADDEREDIEQLVEETLKQKPPKQAPAEAPPGGGGGNVFEEPGEEGQQGGGQGGGGSQPPSSP